MTASEPDNLTLTYALDEARFMAGARAFWSYRAIGDRGNLILAGLGGIAGLALLFYGQPVGWVFLAAVPLFVGLTLLRNALWRRAYRRMLKYSAPIEVRFTEDTVSTRSAEGASDLPWQSFTAYAETPDWVFLFRGRRGLSLIPKSALPHPEDMDTLRGWMAAALPRKPMRWT